MRPRTACRVRIREIGPGRAGIQAVAADLDTGECFELGRSGGRLPPGRYVLEFFARGRAAFLPLFIPDPAPAELRLSAEWISEERRIACRQG